MNATRCSSSSDTSVGDDDDVLLVDAGTPPERPLKTVRVRLPRGAEPAGAACRPLAEPAAAVTSTKANAKAKCAAQPTASQAALAKQQADLAADAKLAAQLAAEELGAGRVTRKRAASEMEPAAAFAAVPARPLRQLRQPPRRLYTMAFTWPAGASWVRAEGDRKRGPSWYADRVTEQIELRAADGASSFLIHVHGAIAPAARATLDERWQGAFDKARAGCGAACGRDSQETLELVVCDAAMPPMWPAALRVSKPPRAALRQLGSSRPAARAPLASAVNPRARE
eukprot:562337-Prymnesium_polylepis.2